MSESFLNQLKQTALAVPAAVLMLGFIQTGSAAFLTWSDGTGNMKWDTVSLNWLNGANTTTWVNSILPNSAGFAATGAGTVTLGMNITAASITFNSGGYTLASNTLTLGGASPSLTNNANAEIDCVLAGNNGFTKAGAGTLILGNANTYTGAAMVNAGKLVGAAPGAFGSYGWNAYNAPNSIIVNTNGILSWTVNAYSSFPGETLYVEGGAVSLDSTNDNSMNTDQYFYLNGGRLTSGNGLAGPANDGGYGNWCFNGATVTVGGSAQSLIDCTTIQIVNGTVFNVGATGAGEDLLVLSQGIEGNPWIKTGPGTMVLSNIYNVTGYSSTSTTISNGALLFNGLANFGPGAGPCWVMVAGGTLGGFGEIDFPVTNSGGTLTAGTSSAIGTLNLPGGVTLNSGSTNFMRITKTGGATASDMISGGASGIANYGGTLVVTNITSGGSALAPGDKFTLFTNWSSYEGAFAAYILAALPSGLSWDVSQLPINGSIAVVSGIAPLIFGPVAGKYLNVQTVTIICTTPGATIYYTTDGSTPATSSPSGSSGLTVTAPANGTTTIKAFAVAAGYPNGVVNSAAYLMESVAVWLDPDGGSWALASNWTNNIIGQGIGAPADFSRLTLASNADVTLDGSWTIGDLAFGDQGNAYTWEIDPGVGGSLTLNAGSNSPAITVSNQITTITAVVAGNNGFTKAGAGTLILGNANTYTGAAMVNAGKLVGAAPGAFGSYGWNAYNAPNSIIVNTNGILSWTVNAYSSFPGETLYVEGGAVSLDSTNDNSMNTDQYFYLNGGRLTSGNGLAGPANDGGYGNWCFNGATVTVGGSAQFLIDCTTIQIVNGSVFNVGVTGTGVDLLVLSQVTVGNSWTKTGLGTMVLSNVVNNPGYGSTSTTVSQGTLLFNGTSSYMGTGPCTVTVAGGTLGGIGSIVYPVTVNAGGTLKAGTSSAIGTLTINNTLTLNSGSATMLRLDKAATNNDVLAGISTLTFGGALTVSNLAGTLALGDTFQLFDATNYAGDFAAMTLPPLGAALGWSWSPTTGTLAVVPSTVPLLNGFGPLKNGSFPLVFGGASGHSYTVLMTTNLALPLIEWTPLTTGVFGAGAVNYMDISATNAQRFYLIESQ